MSLQQVDDLGHASLVVVCTGPWSPGEIGSVTAGCSLTAAGHSSAHDCCHCFPVTSEKTPENFAQPKIWHIQVPEDHHKGQHVVHHQGDQKRLLLLHQVLVLTTPMVPKGWKTLNFVHGLVHDVKLSLLARLLEVEVVVEATTELAPEVVPVVLLRSY